MENLEFWYKKRINDLNHICTSTENISNDPQISSRVSTSCFYSCSWQFSSVLRNLIKTDFHSFASVGMFQSSSS